MKASFLSYYCYYDSNGAELGNGNYTFDINYTDTIDAGILLQQATDWLLKDLRMNADANTARVVIKNVVRV